jgi:hypothetical protein
LPKLELSNIPVLHGWRFSKILADKFPPLHEQITFAKANGVILKGLPIDMEGVGIGPLNALV